MLANGTSIVGGSPRQVKRRRASLRAAGIDPSALPVDYVRASVTARSQMVADGEVGPEVGMADTSRGVRVVARRVLWLQRGDYAQLSGSQLVELVRLPQVTTPQLEGLGVEALRRPRAGRLLAAVCAHPRCPSSVLTQTMERSRGEAVVVALLALAERGAGSWSSLPELTSAQRLVLTRRGPVDAVAYLVDDPSDEVRRALAKRPLGSVAAMVLATDRDPEVRLELARHTGDGRVLGWLRDDEDPRVRVAAYRALHSHPAA